MHSQPRHYVEVNVQLHAPVSLLGGKETPIPTEEEAAWALEAVCTRWRTEKIPAPAGNRIQALQLVTQLL